MKKNIISVHTRVGLVMIERIHITHVYVWVSKYFPIKLLFKFKVAQTSFWALDLVAHRYGWSLVLHSFTENAPALHTGQRAWAEFFLRARVRKWYCLSPEVRACSSHRSIQTAWNVWEQRRRRVTTGGTMSSRQMEHVLTGMAVGINGQLAFKISNNVTRLEWCAVFWEHRRIYHQEAVLKKIPVSSIATTQIIDNKRTKRKAAETTTEADMKSVGVSLTLSPVGRSTDWNPTHRRHTHRVVTRAVMGVEEVSFSAASGTPRVELLNSEFTGISFQRIRLFPLPDLAFATERSHSQKKISFQRQWMIKQVIQGVVQTLQNTRSSTIRNTTADWPRFEFDKRINVWGARNGRPTYSKQTIFLNLNELNREGANRDSNRYEAKGGGEIYFDAE